MKILLIWPYGAFDGATLPLCYLYLIPILKKKHEVKFIDCALHEIHPNSEKFSKIISDFQPDVVGVSAWTVHKDMARSTLKKVKTLNSKIITIAGGPHFTGSANYSISNDVGIIDYVLKGEAELTFLEFLDTVSKKQFTNDDLKKIDGLCFVENDGSIHESPMLYPPSLDDFGQPDYTEINLFGYFKKGYSYRSDVKMQAPILSTRGCPYTCDFCSAPYLNGRGIRKHSLNYLLELIENLYVNFGIRHFNIIDDNFTFDTFYAKSFCKKIIDNKHKFKNISFGTPNGIRVERTDKQLFYLMKSAGWSRLIIAPESGSQEMVDKMSKHLDLTLIPEKVKQVQNAGLEVEGFFIIGHPGETKATVGETKKFIKEVKFDMVSPHIFQPLSGTPIYDQLLSLGSISEDITMNSYSEINWIPENWTKNELLKEIFDLKKISILNFPFRFELFFSRYTVTGKLIARLFGQKLRHKLYNITYHFRKKIWNIGFNIKNAAELKKQIQGYILEECEAEDERKRNNKLKEYEKRIMQKSDELKKMALEEQIIKIQFQKTKLGLILNDCDKILTHKKFSD